MTHFEPKPRWSGAPAVCIAENRLAFPDHASLQAYRASIGMSAYGPRAIWRCATCGHWHYLGRTPNPSGDSSGTSRDSKAADKPLTKPAVVSAFRRLRESVK